VLADHIRACAFLISDGVIPGNEGRGYVLRRIIRRAIRHGYKLGARAAFFHRMLPDLVAEMGAAYPELVSNQDRVSEVLRQEEVRFFETIEHGMSILEGELAAMSGKGVFNGATAFKLHDTFRFPARSDRRRLPRARGQRRRCRFRCGDGAAEGAGACRRQVQDGRGARLQRTGRRNSMVTKRSNSAARCWRSTGTAARSMSSGKANWASSSSTRRRSTPNPAVRSATAACCRARRAFSAVEDTQKIQAAVFGHQGSSGPALIRVGDASPPGSTCWRARARCATIRRRI
jgi:alanyl-tRNA synthetase